MPSKILIPVDLAHLEFAADLLDCGVDIAQRRGADIRVVAVLPKVMAEARFYVSDEQHEELRAKVEARLKALAKDRLDRNAEIEVLDTRDAVYRAVIDDCNLHGCDLIVVGAHRPGFSEFLLGSNAAKIARHAPCDVYIKRA